MGNGKLTKTKFWLKTEGWDTESNGLGPGFQFYNLFFRFGLIYLWCHQVPPAFLVFQYIFIYFIDKILFLFSFFRF